MSTPKHDITATSGWLSPDGFLYPCEWGGHEELARQLGLIYAPLHGVRDWLHLNDGMWRDPAMWDDANTPVSITQAQVDTIYEWCLAHDARVPAWFHKAAVK